MTHLASCFIMKLAVVVWAANYALGLSSASLISTFCGLLQICIYLLESASFSQVQLSLLLWARQICNIILKNRFLLLLFRSNADLLTSWKRKQWRTRMTGKVSWCGAVHKRRKKLLLGNFVSYNSRDENYIHLGSRENLGEPQCQKVL